MSFMWFILVNHAFLLGSLHYYTIFSPKTQEKNKNQKDEKVLAGMDIREDQEMYARIRAELLEELKQEYDQEKTK